MGAEPVCASFAAKGGIGLRPSLRHSVGAITRSLTLEASAGTTDGTVDERRIRQAEASLLSQPRLHPV
jgi:hypothetical protein